MQKNEQIQKKEDSLFNLSKNDGNTFKLIFKQYFAALCYFANKFVFDKQEAEDIVEEVFEKLLSKDYHTYNTAHLRSYLYITTKHTCIDHLRKNNHAKERQMSFAAQLGDQDPGHIHEIIRSEVLREIYLEIRNLPEQCGKIVAMSYIEGLKNEEIAKKLELSLQTVKNQKSRGISLLRTRLSADLFMVFIMVFGMK